MRKTRSDKGQIRLTPRDTSVLTWIGEQYAVRVDTLQKLLGRLSTQVTKVEGVVSESTANEAISRWKQEQLVQSRKYFFREPGWVWLTGKGLSFLDLGFKVWSPSSRMTHYHDVNEVRFRIEQQFRDQGTWRSERHLRQLHWKDKDIHIPDGEVHLASEGKPAESVFAVEIELTQKSRQRIDEVIDKLVRRYDGVWYFVNKQTRPVIEQATRSNPEFFKLYDIERVRGK